GSQQVILMDAYRSRGIPPHLVTREFNQLAHDRLAQPGVFLANVIDRGRVPLLAASVATTRAIDCPAVDLWISDATSDEGLTNIVVAAWSDADTAVRPPIIAVD